MPSGVGIGFSAPVQLLGPFFEKGPSGVQDAIREATEELIETGENLVKDELYSGHGLVTGHLRRSVAGEMTGPLSGIIDTPVIYGPWVEGVSRRNDSSRFKGYAMFRKAAQKLDEDAEAIVLAHLQRRGYFK